jgi:ssDNA-specific exonuclease RecJ
MEKIAVYRAEDGKIFNNEAECVEHELREKMKTRIDEELKYATSDEIYDWIVRNTKGFK